MKNYLKRLSLNMMSSLTALLPSAAWASTDTDLPFDSTLDTLQKAISGPFLTYSAIIMIVVTCLMLAFGEWGDGFKKIITVVMWLSIAFAALTFIQDLFTTGAVV